MPTLHNPINDWNGFYERAKVDGQLIEKVIKDFYISNLTSSAVAIDGGANIGHHTKALGAHLSDGLVIGVEANSNTFLELQQNCASLSNVRLKYSALQADLERLTINFHRSPSHPGRSGVGKLWDLLTPGEVEYSAPEEVPATTIDSLVDEFSVDRLDFIKLDLEGGEFAALRGGLSSISKLRPIIVTEHSHLSAKLNDYSLSDYFNWIHSIGYQMVSPSGHAISIDNPFPFWYIFLVPREKLQHWSIQITSALSTYL